MLVRRPQRLVGVLFQHFPEQPLQTPLTPIPPMMGFTTSPPPRFTTRTLAGDTVVGDEYLRETLNFNSRNHFRVWKWVIGGRIQCVPRWCSDNRQKPEP